MRWIKEIEKVDFYIVTCQWNDGVIREVDLGEFILDKNPENTIVLLGWACSVSLC